MMAKILLNGNICIAMTSSWAIILSRVENRVETMLRDRLQIGFLLISILKEIN